MFSTLHFNPYNLFAASVSRWLPSANSHRPNFAVTKAQRLEFLGFSRSMMSIVSIVPLFYDQKLSQAVMTAVLVSFVSHISLMSRNHSGYAFHSCHAFHLCHVFRSCYTFHSSHVLLSLNPIISLVSRVSLVSDAFCSCPTP